MRLPRPWTLLALVLAPAAGGAHAGALPRQAAAAAPMPEARAVIQRFAEVTRWNVGVEKTRSRHERGRLQLSGMEGTIDTYIAKPDRQVSVLELVGFGKLQSGYDGQVAWITTQMTGPKLLSGTDLLQARLEAGYDALLKPAELYESLRTLGRKTFEGKECWELELVAKPLEGMDAEKTRAARTTLEYYEVTSGLLIGATGQQESELASGPFTRVYEDYREFGGYLLPARARVKQGGIESRMTTDSVEFDTLGEEALATPADVRKLIEAAAAKAPAKLPAGSAPK